MTGYLITALAILFWLCIALLVLLVGRHRGARREETRLQQIANDLGEKWLIERQKVRHLQERNADLRDELDLLTTDPSLTAEVYGYLATLTETDPGDQR